MAIALSDSRNRSLTKLGATNGMEIWVVMQRFAAAD